MGSAPVPHPDYLITLVGGGLGAGAGIPGAAVRDAATGRVVDRICGKTQVFSAVAGTAGNRQFFLTVGIDRQTAEERGRQSAGLPASSVINVHIDDDGQVTELTAVRGFPDPGFGESGPGYVAVAADGSAVAYPFREPRPPPERQGGHPVPVRPWSDFPPPEVHIVTTATGEHAFWRAGPGNSPQYLSLSANGRRMAFKRNNPEGDGIFVADLPDIGTGGDITTPSRLVVPEQGNGLGNLGQAVISPDGSKLYVTAARYGSGGQPVTRLAEVSVADGEVLRIVYERRGADPNNVIFGWGPLVIDPSGQHALIGYAGNLGRIDLGAGQFTELPLEENGAYAIAW